MLSVSTRTKAIDAELRLHFGKRLEQWVRETHEGNQSAAGRVLGVSQSHISAIISGTRGVGLHFLLLFAAATDSTIDDLLGMAKHGTEEERIRRLLREELAAIRAERPAEKEPHAKPLRGRPALRRGVLE